MTAVSRSLSLIHLRFKPVHKFLPFVCVSCGPTIISTRKLSHVPWSTLPPFKTICVRGKRPFSATANAEIYKAYFSKEDIEKILKTVNETTNINDLQKFGFPKRAIKEVAEKRNLSQPIANLDDLVAILGSKSSSRVFCSILDRPLPTTRNPIFPFPPPEVVTRASVVVSLVINGNQISWCCIERSGDQQFSIQALHQQQILLKTKSHFLTILNEMMTLSGLIPKSHICIIEEYPNSAPNPLMFAFHLHMAQIRSFLLGSIASGVTPPQIIAIRTVAVARLFNTAIGSERVSGQHLVDNMVTWKPLPSLIVPNKLKDEYETSQPIIKEGLANSILLNLAYWRLTKQFTDFYT